MAKKSMTKGKGFERQGARIMTEATGSLWKRTVTSGSQRDSETSGRFTGDIYSDDHQDLVVECKAIKSMNISELYSDRSNLSSFMSQAKREAGDDMWLLLLKVDRLGVYAISPWWDPLSYFGKRQTEDTVILRDGAHMVRIR